MVLSEEARDRFAKSIDDLESNMGVILHGDLDRHVFVHSLSIVRHQNGSTLRTRVGRSCGSCFRRVGRRFRWRGSGNSRGRSSRSGSWRSRRRCTRAGTWGSTLGGRFTWLFTWVETTARRRARLAAWYLRLRARNFNAVSTECPVHGGMVLDITGITFIQFKVFTKVSYHNNSGHPTAAISIDIPRSRISICVDTAACCKVGTCMLDGNSSSIPFIANCNTHRFTRTRDDNSICGQGHHVSFATSVITDSLDLRIRHSCAIRRLSRFGWVSGWRGAWARSGGRSRRGSWSSTWASGRAGRGTSTRASGRS
mmetsp:Transcript_13219/g.27345  ORF Transcript_13219/g.27345 Transcript_13219/m.27345 type:complete len:311 (+) Transcript_13219:748-1680(+)